ncbi:MAG: YeeE/YedE thiosulfate transporter family protein, partial [Gammaproteobacteria bacterium]
MGDLNLWLVGGGLFIGLLFGIVVQRTQFCMITALSNVALMRDYRHAHAYFAALLVAILGTLFLEAGGLVAISETGYRVPQYDWLVIIGGGLLFGFGSMLAGGCAGRTTVRVAEGNLGSLVVLLAFALTAAATYFGALEPYRVWLIQNTAIELESGDSALSAVLGLPLWVGSAVIAVFCFFGILFLGKSRRSYGLIAAGIVVGALVVAGWYVTGYLSQDDFSEHRASSIVIAGPLARATVFLTTGSMPGYGFSVAVLVGTIAGALASALVTRSFHLIIPEA